MCIYIYTKIIILDNVLDIFWNIFSQQIWKMQLYKMALWEIYYNNDKETSKHSVKKSMYKSSQLDTSVALKCISLVLFWGRFCLGPICLWFKDYELKTKIVLQLATEQIGLRFYQHIIPISLLSYLFNQRILFECWLWCFHIYISYFCVRILLINHFERSLKIFKNDCNVNSNPYIHSPAMLKLPGPKKVSIYLQENIKTSISILN